MTSASADASYETEQALQVRSEDRYDGPDGELRTYVTCGLTAVVLGSDVVDNYTDVALRHQRLAEEHAAIAAWAWREC